MNNSLDLRTYSKKDLVTTLNETVELKNIADDSLAKLKNVCAELEKENDKMRSILTMHNLLWLLK